MLIFSIELRDTGLYGFILPPEQIIPTAEETWAFHKVRRASIVIVISITLCVCWKIPG